MIRSVVLPIKPVNKAFLLTLPIKKSKNKMDTDCITKQLQKVAICSTSEEKKRTNVSRLREIYNRSSVSHANIILAEKSLKDAHMYCVLNNIGAQQYGPLIEKYIISKFSMTKNNASNCTGDCTYNDQNIEIKASLGGKMFSKFNFVQIRLSQKVDFYLCTAYYLADENIDDEGELFVFKVPKENMKTLIIKYGGYAHGTISVNGKITSESVEKNENTKVEYALRPTYNDKCWKSLLEYRVSEHNPMS